MFASVSDVHAIHFYVHCRGCVLGAWWSPIDGVYVTLSRVCIPRKRRCSRKRRLSGQRCSSGGKTCHGCSAIRWQTGIHRNRSWKSITPNIRIPSAETAYSSRTTPIWRKLSASISFSTTSIWGIGWWVAVAAGIDTLANSSRLSLLSQEHSVIVGAGAAISVAIASLTGPAR